MKLPRQEDIEIYVRDCAVEELEGWIESSFSPLGRPDRFGDTLVYPSSLGPVTLTNVGGPFVGIWFATPRSPWATDVDCARQAATELKRVVRCDPGRHSPEVDPQSDVFLEIDDGVERLVEWHDEDD